MPLERSRPSGLQRFIGVFLLRRRQTHGVLFAVGEPSMWFPFGFESHVPPNDITVEFAARGLCRPCCRRSSGTARRPPCRSLRWRLEAASQTRALAKHRAQRLIPGFSGMRVCLNARGLLSFTLERWHHMCRGSVRSLVSRMGTMQAWNCGFPSYLH